jgi:hypothetical protein
MLHFSGKCLKVYTTTETFLTAFQFIKQGVDTAHPDLITIITLLYSSFHL